MMKKNILKLNLLILLIPYILLIILSPYALGKEFTEIIEKLFGLFIYIIVFNPMLLILYIIISIADYMLLRYQNYSLFNIIQKEIIISFFLVVILFGTILPVNEYYLTLSILYCIALLVRWFILSKWSYFSIQKDE